MHDETLRSEFPSPTQSALRTTLKNVFRPAADGRLLAALVVACSLLTFGASAAPYTNDANTVLLDHLNGSTAGSLRGTAGFTNGLAALSQSANLPLGGYIMYGAYVPYSTSGTIELWVKPLQHPCSIMTFNTSYTTSQPGAGYVMHLTLNANGTVHWYGGGNFDSVSVVPTNQWSHVAVTWGSGGTTIYINGMQDAHTGTTYNPSSGYLYLNSTWGAGAIGCVDEVRISKVARTAGEFRDHYIANSGKYHRLDVAIQGLGSVTPTNGWYDTGTNLTLSATPSPDWLFTGWSGSFSAGYAASNTSLLLDGDKQITATFSDDADGDGLLNTAEWSLGTDPRNRDTDGDGFDDGFETQHGYSPLVSDTALTDYIRAHNSAFNLYPSNAVLDVAVGQVLMSVTNGSARLNLQLQQADTLGGPWTNAGSAIEWSTPVGGEKKFFRVRSAP